MTSAPAHILNPDICTPPILSGDPTTTHNCQSEIDSRWLQCREIVLKFMNAETINPADYMRATAAAWELETGIHAHAKVWWRRPEDRMLVHVVRWRISELLLEFCEQMKTLPARGERDGDGVYLGVGEVTNATASGSGTQVNTPPPLNGDTTSNTPTPTTNDPASSTSITTAPTSPSIALPPILYKGHQPLPDRLFEERWRKSARLFQYHDRHFVRRNNDEGYRRKASGLPFPDDMVTSVSELGMRIWRFKEKGEVPEGWEGMTVLSSGRILERVYE